MRGLCWGSYNQHKELIGAMAGENRELTKLEVQDMESLTLVQDILIHKSVLPLRVDLRVHLPMQIQEQVRGVLTILEQCPNIVDLTLTNTSKYKFKIIDEELEKGSWAPTSLQKVVFDHCKFKIKVSMNLMSRVIASQDLRVLNFWGCQFAFSIVPAFLALLTKSQRLRELNLSAIRILTQSNAELEEAYNSIGIALSQLRYLEDLSIEGIEFEALLIIKKIFSHKQHFRNLNLDDLNLRAQGLGEVESYLIKHNLESLSLKANYLGVTGGKVIGNLFEKIPTLSKLDLGNNNIQDEGFRDIMKGALKGSGVIEFINLTQNHIRMLVGVTEALDLFSACRIKMLKLDMNHMDLDGVTNIRSLLETQLTVMPHQRITKLMLDKIALDDAGAQILSGLFSQSCGIEYLSLIDNKIGDAGAVAIANALCHNQTIRDLFLGYNIDIKDEGAIALANLVQTSKTLKILQLHFCSIGHEGALAFSKVFSLNPSTRHFVLRNNPVGGLACKEILKSMKDNTTMQILNLSACDMGSFADTEVTSSLTKNKSIEHLWLLYNQLTSTDAPAFQEVISKNSSIIWLNLQGNEFDDESAKFFEQGISHNDKIKTLDLGCCQLTNTGKRLLRQFNTGYKRRIIL